MFNVFYLPGKYYELLIELIVEHELFNNNSPDTELFYDFRYLTTALY